VGDLLSEGTAADCGGSNGNRLRAFKVEIVAFAAQTGLQITVCHFPPSRRPISRRPSSSG
jgi:Rhodopirellula transposase DDE domain